MTNPTIARLAALCDESGLTRCDIAERAGIKPCNMTRLLSGQVDPKASTLDRVLRAIGCKWADLDAD